MLRHLRENLFFQLDPTQAHTNICYMSHDILHVHESILTSFPGAPSSPGNPFLPGLPWIQAQHNYRMTTSINSSRTGVPGCPGTPFLPAGPTGPCMHIKSLLDWTNLSYDQNLPLLRLNPGVHVILEVPEFRDYIITILSLQ